ncbi:MAG: hypothetical protein WCQ57_01490 [Verrucomicrobiota bacterium]
MTVLWDAEIVHLNFGGKEIHGPLSSQVILRVNAANMRDCAGIAEPNPVPRRNIFLQPYGRLNAGAEEQAANAVLPNNFGEGRFRKFPPGQKQLAGYRRASRMMNDKGRPGGIVGGLISSEVPNHCNSLFKLTVSVMESQAQHLKVVHPHRIQPRQPKPPPGRDASKMVEIHSETPLMAGEGGHKDEHPPDPAVDEDSPQGLRLVCREVKFIEAVAEVRGARADAIQHLLMPDVQSQAWIHILPNESHVSTKRAAMAPPE